MKSDKKSTKDRIVEAAIRLFRGGPCEQVSLKEICEEAGVTRNSFYYYFEARSKLYDAIAEWCVSTAKSRTLQALDSHTFYGQVWNFYRLYLETQLSLGQDVMNHIATARTEHPRSDYSGYVDSEMADAMARLIRRAQESGEIRNDQPPERLVWTSYALIRGVNIRWCFRWGETDLLKEARTSLNDLFLPGPEYRLEED